MNLSTNDENQHRARPTRKVECELTQLSNSLNSSGFFLSPRVNFKFLKCSLASLTVVVLPVKSSNSGAEHAIDKHKVSRTHDVVHAREKEEIKLLVSRITASAQKSILAS